MASMRMVSKTQAVASPGSAMMVSWGRIWPPRRLPSGSIQAAWQWMNGLLSDQPKVALAYSIRVVPGGADGAVK